MSQKTAVKTDTDRKHILEVTDLKVHFPIHGGLFLKQVGEVKAVDGVSFSMKPGETLGMVGESGCGKTTIGKALINLAPVTSGRIMFPAKDGTMTDIAGLNRSAMRPFRSRIQMVFQDPYSSLNPRMSVEAIVSEPLDIHLPELGRKEKREKVGWLLEKVGLRAAYASRYPHEFFGGPGPWRRTPPSSSPTSRSPRWTSRYRRRSSTCCRTCRTSSTSPTCSSPTTCRWWSISATA